MTTLVFRDGKMVEKHLASGDVDAPFVIRDEMEPTVHMATGRVISSKRKFRAETKAAGCIEVGDHVFKPRQPVKLDRRERVESIRQTIYELRNGRRA